MTHPLFLFVGFLNLVVQDFLFDSFCLFFDSFYASLLVSIALAFCLHELFRNFEYGVCLKVENLIRNFM